MSQVWIVDMFSEPLRELEKQMVSELQLQLEMAHQNTLASVMEGFISLGESSSGMIAVRVVWGWCDEEFDYAQKTWLSIFGQSGRLRFAKKFRVGLRQI